jgi:hypothetical protein
MTSSGIPEWAAYFTNWLSDLSSERLRRVDQTFYSLYYRRVWSPYSELPLPSSSWTVI